MWQPRGHGQHQHNADGAVGAIQRPSGWPSGWGGSVVSCSVAAGSKRTSNQPVHGSTAVRRIGQKQVASLGSRWPPFVLARLFPSWPRPGKVPPVGNVFTACPRNRHKNNGKRATTVRSANPRAPGVPRPTVASPRARSEFPKKPRPRSAPLPF